MDTKLRIAIDMDEVLADTIDKFIEIYKHEHQIELPLAQMHGKEFHELLPAHISPTVRNYINQKGFFRDIKVMPDSQRVVRELCNKYEVFIVSAAMEFRNSLEDKLDWLAEHFAFIPWTNIIFCGAKIVNVDIMIDDRIRNFAHFSGRKMLYSSPHNLLISDYERVNNWGDIAKKLL